MAELFTRSSDSVLRVALFSIAVLTGGLVFGPMIYVRTPYHQNSVFPVDQPVQFDHRHHVQDDGIDCVYCHNTVYRSATAGIPSTELCMGCHNQIWSHSPMLETVRQSWFSGQPIAWNRVNLLPGYVYFDHSIHVSKGVGCSTCHGRVDQMARVYQARSLTMAWCLACHRDPKPFLRPPDRITDMKWRPSPRQSALGEELAREYGVRSRTDCVDCHR